jgi:hypothetical protein
MQQQDGSWQQTCVRMMAKVQLQGKAAESAQVSLAVTDGVAAGDTLKGRLMTTKHLGECGECRHDCSF